MTPPRWFLRFMRRYFVSPSTCRHHYVRTIDGDLRCTNCGEIIPA